MKFTMQWLQRAKDLWRPRQRPRHALALAGGGVIGGMFEVGAITALEERLNGHGRFDIYVGCSAGAVVASFLANGLPASEIFRVIDNDLDDPLNFRRNAVYASDSFRHAAVAEAGARNLDVCRAEAERLPVSDGSIDVALVNGIFNLNPARAEIFRELARVVRPGGAVFAAELILREPLPPTTQFSEADWFA